ncbi:MAG: hypothetical protein COY66_00730 [Candidatus Kerfeldbacteria bacterium CG_4_10_14_0_8_um_filter_42_10]|uniref:Nudix hydrolase domain-containing protein n=1 Tax=Candidatus Kerfeldbacteria bacterium CG_4_10_14_0_8_um_filter_42_10 TaxID=2014248 RepID=A0A2M7RKB6_9BACT|nr:MAG: hypothetical protein COY66_00730 [Candidatus Kerfeldbacteria bacterium CG_4_10_14_0_8_um_filter_42_10]
MVKKHGLYQISLKLILKNRKGQILALGGLDNGSYAGLYDFPGGRINDKEFRKPLTEILKREVTEEIGKIKYDLNEKPVAVGRHLLRASISGSKKDAYVLYLFFEGMYKGGKITISNEHKSCEWLNLKSNNLSKYFSSGNLEGIRMYLLK